MILGDYVILVGRTKNFADGDRDRLGEKRIEKSLVLVVIVIRMARGEMPRQNNLHG